MSRAPSFVRATAIIVGGAITLWIAIGVTFSLTLAGALPAFARVVWPSGITAKVAQARGLLLAQTPPSEAAIDKARSDLREAALREPVNTQALGTLAALEDYRKNEVKARQLFRLSEAVSRRNSLTELWLLEDAVRRGDVAGAINHYDRAMRVSLDLRPQLLPVLVAASSSAAIQHSLMPVLAQRPLWWKDYLQQAAQEGQDAAVLGAVLRSTRINIRDPEERVLAENILRRMVALKGGRMAVQAANQLEGLSATHRSLRGGDFEAPDGLLPFAWWLRDETSIRAYRDAVPNGGMGLRIVTNSGASGGVAQQLVSLAPGRYTLQGMAGDISSDPTARPALDVGCDGGKQLLHGILPAAGEEGQRFAFAFDVPAAGCDLQWISVTTAPAVDTDVWLDKLAITR